MADFPPDHPLAPFADDLDTHADHLDALGQALFYSDPEEYQAVMLVVTGENGTETIPSVSEDVDPRWASLWMLGAHIHHVAAAARESGDGTATMQTVAEDAIRYMEEHAGAEAVY